MPPKKRNAPDDQAASDSPATKKACITPKHPVEAKGALRSIEHTCMPCVPRILDDASVSCHALYAGYKGQYLTACVECDGPDTKAKLRCKSSVVGDYPSVLAPFKKFKDAAERHAIVANAGPASIMMNVYQEETRAALEAVLEKERQERQQWIQEQTFRNEFPAKASKRLDAIESKQGEIVQTLKELMDTQKQLKENQKQMMDMIKISSVFSASGSQDQNTSGGLARFVGSWFSPLF